MPQQEGASYFANRSCPHFPCHALGGGEDFNCLFCFCPLYPLGVDCGGQFSLLPQGGKDCSACCYPHQPAHYPAIVAALGELSRRFPPALGTASQTQKGC